MKVTDFNTLTFDCYGTLIDWEAGILSEIRPWIAGQGLALDDNALLEAFGEAESTCEAKSPHKLYPEILAEAHRHLAGIWKIETNKSADAEFGQSVGRWPAFSDSSSALRYLKQYYKLVILSNVDHKSFAKSNAKLGVIFDKIITAQDIGSYKPNRRNFQYLIDELAGIGVDKTSILHTAQSLFHDIIPAKQIGLKTLWVNRRKGLKGWGATPAPSLDVKPDFEVASLAEFVTLHQNQLQNKSTK